MREGWKEVELREITLLIKRGISPKYVDNNGIIVINQKCIRDNKISFDDARWSSKEKKISNEKIIAIGDTLVNSTGTGTLGRTGYVKRIFDQTTVDTHVTIIRPNINIVNARFLGFLMNYSEPQIESLGKGATNQIELSANDLGLSKFLLPPLETQKKIASILSSYDDLIENNLKRIKILEEMAQQTYEEWFVRMRFPGYETATINPATGLPKGWEKVKLGDLGDVVTGKTPSTSKEEYYNGEIPFIKTPDMNGQVYVIETSQYLTEMGANSQKMKFIPKNSLVVSCIGSAGVYALVSRDSQFNQQINAIKFKEEKYSFFSYCYAKGLKEVLDALGSNGATMTNVNKSKFEQIEIVVPMSGLLSKFHQFTKPCFESILNLQNQNQRLREARDILLPRLMMGMIDVSVSSVERVERLEIKPDAKIIPLTQPKKEISKEFKEAILIACLTERFGSEKFPLGRKRYTKLSYLFHRYSDNKIQDYLRKAAGPYNPKTKYAGPEKIALNSKYIQNWKGDKGTTGFVAAEKIEDAKKYFSHYWQITDLDWLVTAFKFKSNDELELLATVDNSLMELSKENMEFTSGNVLEIIKSEKEWEAKLERTIFSYVNVERAIGYLTTILKY